MATVAHFEIHASNPELLVEFYSRLFGWRFESWGPPGQYWVIRTKQDGDERGSDGGLVPRKGDRPGDAQPVSAYVVTIDVASATNTLTLVEELGGVVVVPLRAVVGVGLHAYAKDPDGNIFGIMEPALHAT